MKRKIMFKSFIAGLFAFAVMLIPAVNTEASQTKVAGHTVFSEKQIDARIKIIQKYYYNMPNKLTIRKQNIRTNGSVLKMKYYIHGKDLMFGFGIFGKTEYRLYFYKNQLVRMLVDKPGKSRKTYRQLYKRLENSDFSLFNSTLSMYMVQEGRARIMMDYVNSKTKKILLNDMVVITKVSGNKIVYHKLDCYGPDGWIGSIGSRAYVAYLSSNVKIRDMSESPDWQVKRSVKWLKKKAEGSSIGWAANLYAKGNKITKIVCPYFA